MNEESAGWRLDWCAACFRPSEEEFLILPQALRERTRAAMEWAGDTAGDTAHDASYLYDSRPTPLGMPGWEAKRRWMLPRE